MVVAAPRPGFGSFSRPDRAHRTAAAYSGFDGPVTFVDLSPFGANGHQTFAKADPAAWAAPVAAFPGIVTAMTR